MKKYLVLITISLLLFSGCNDNKVVSNGKKVDTSNMIHEHCIRTGSVKDGEASLEYDIYYTGEVFNIIVSNEKVTSTNKEVLDTYEEAYRKIHSYYEGLEYYDTSVIRTSDYVESSMTINYDKVDIKKLISIEGEDDNIFEDNIPKIEKWKELAKKVGTKCSIVTEE